MAHGTLQAGRIASAEHERGGWRIGGIVPDFRLEDVWALPAEGSAEDFPKLLGVVASLDFTASDSAAGRFLWQLRDRLGRWFDLGRVAAVEPDQGRGADELPVPGTRERSLAGRLPADLRGTADDVHFEHLPFVPLYRTPDEFAAEVSNRTVHGVAHLAWVDRGDGSHQGQMAVYVKPRGRFGEAYMAFIKPFRYWIVYPALERQIERAWRQRQTAR